MVDVRMKQALEQALYELIGEKQFRTWLQGLELPVVSCFQTRARLTLQLKKAGFRAILYGRLIKTYYEPDRFFFWEERHGVWYAVFSVYDEPTAVAAFMKRLNAHGPVFAEEELCLPQVQAPQCTLFSTTYVEAEQVQAVLERYGLRPRTAGHQVECVCSDVRLTFEQRGEGEPFYLVVRNPGGLPLSPALHRLYTDVG